MVRNIVWTVLFSIIAAILQSTLIGRIPFVRVLPDLALCIIVFSAYVNGTMTGQVSGFFSGLLLDFLSAAPIGMNCLIRTLIGALAGVFKGAFFLDVFFMPVALCAIATLLKAFIVFILHLIMGPTVPKLPHRIGEKLDPMEMYAYDILTVIANLSGIPAGSMKAGEVDGIPVGLQIQSKSFEDDKIIKAFSAIEEI